MALIFLSGCGDLHLYNKGKDNLAKEARTDFEKIEIAEVVSKERENRKAIRDQQVSLSKRSGEARAQYRVLALVQSKAPIAESIWASNLMMDRLTRLGIERPGIETQHTLYGAGVLGDELATQAQILSETAGEIFVIAGAAPSPCLPHFATAPPPGEHLSAEQKERLTFFFETYQTQCQEAKEAIGELTAPLGFADPSQIANPSDSGDSNRAIADGFIAWQKATTELESERAAAQRATSAYKAAKKAYDEEAAKNDDSPDVAEKTAEVAKKLKKAIAGLDEAGDFLSIEFISEERHKALEGLVQAVAAGADPEAADKSPKLDRTAVVAASIPSLAESVDAFVESGDPPPVSGLALEMRRQRLNRDYSQRQVEHRAALVDVKRLQLMALLREAADYRRVRDELCKVVRLAHDTPSNVEIACETLKVESNPVSCRFRYRERVSSLEWKLRVKEEPPLNEAACPLSTTLQKATAGQFIGVPSDRAVEAKIAFNFTLASYVNADTVARAKFDEAVYEELFINEEIALDADEYAANSWNALIAEPLNALAAYHASGIKAEDVASALSNLVGLGAVAVGSSQ